MVSDGKRQELEVLTRQVQMMRAEAAVKAWARVAVLLSNATQSASKEYAGTTPPRAASLDCCCCTHADAPGPIRSGAAAAGRGEGKRAQAEGQGAAVTPAEARQAALRRPKGTSLE